MLAEKKSLVRFLVIYVFSTIFLIGIGEYFYYKLAKQSIIEKEKLVLDNKIDNYLKQRVKIHKFGNFQLLDNMAIFKDKLLIASNFEIPKEIDFNKIVWTKDNKIFYLKHLIRPFGDIYILTYKQLPKDNLIQKLIIFNIVMLIFIGCISILLGEVFLSPMKKTIQKLEDFMRDTTHELNTPISIINSNIELLKMKNVDFKEFNRILNATKRLNKIFDDLKFVSLTHQIKNERTKVNLKEVILDRIHYFEISPKLELEDVFVKVDKEDIIRVIDNLLSNAKKYSNNYIKIELKKKYLIIENDGIIKDIQNITKKYVRENNQEGGFGLGLYIVNEICKKYNWKLKIKSKNNRVIVKIYI